MSALLVVGATGLLGSAICARARAAGHDVRALVRAESPRAQQLRDLGCRTVSGDLKDTGSLARACRDRDAVVTTANALLSRSPGDSLGAVDRDGSMALIGAAATAGVRHFIYTSIAPALPANNPFVRYKREVEHAVRGCGLSWTIVQPTAFMEIHTGAPAGWDFTRGRARMVGTGSIPVGYISIGDVAAFAVAALTHPAALNRDLPLAGPAPLSARDAVAIAEAVTGRRFSVQRAPVALVRVARGVVGPFHPPLASLLGMMLAQAAGDGPLPAPLYETFGLTPTPFADYVRATLAGHSR